nr:MAG TPA: hypothetical protein [Caudoviricetes sp.]DAH80606.1 MAG TPA: hypothetical protein [Caudoviricetes sp.]
MTKKLNYFRFLSAVAKTCDARRRRSPDDI